MKRSTVILASAGAALVLVTAGTAAGAAIAGPVDGSGVIYGCYTTKASGGSHTLVLQDVGTTCAKGNTAIQWNQTGPQGLPGKAGTNGTNGTNGNSFLSSSGAPGGSCNTGDTDLDRATGEYYSCTASAWTDTGQNIQPAPVTLTWTISCTASPCSGNSTESIPAGAVLTPESGTLTQAGSCVAFPAVSGTISDNAGTTLATIDPNTGNLDPSPADMITTANAGTLQYQFDSGHADCYASSVTFTFKVTGANLTPPFS